MKQSWRHIVKDDYVDSVVGGLRKKTKLKVSLVAFIKPV